MIILFQFYEINGISNEKKVYIGRGQAIYNSPLSHRMKGTHNI